MGMLSKLTWSASVLLSHCTVDKVVERGDWLQTIKIIKDIGLRYPIIAEIDVIDNQRFKYKYAVTPIKWRHSCIQINSK